MGENENDKNECPCDDDGAENNCLSYKIAFGRMLNAPELGNGNFIIYLQEPSPTLATPGKLFYDSPLLYSYTYTYSGPKYSGLNLIVYIREGAMQIPYSFRNNETIGYPDASASVNSRKRLQRLDISLNPTTSPSPAYFRLFNESGGSTLISTSTHKAISYTTAKGRVLTLDSPAIGMEIIYDDAGSIRQIRSNADGLADVVMTNITKYQIRFYYPSQVGAKSNGVYTVSGTPYKYYEVYLPDGTNYLDIRIKKVAGSVESESRFVYSDSQKDWTLVKNPESAESVRISKSKAENGSLICEFERTYNADDVLLYERKSLFEKSAFGKILKESYEGPVSYGLKTTYEYYDSTGSSTVGLYGKIKSISYSTGNWEKYEYDANGRLIKKVSAWKNNPKNSADSQNHVTLYTYDSNILDQRPRTVEEKIAGVTVSKTYYEYTVDTATGEMLEIEEIAAAPTAAYGSAGNLRTVRRYYAPNAQGQLAGRLKCVTHPDLTCDTYTYDYGTFSAGTDFGAYTFTVDNINGNALRTVVTHGTSANPDGIAGKTTREITIKDSSANPVVTETYVYTGSGYEKVQWKEFRFDDENHEIASADNQGHHTETTWNCCSKTSFTDWDGTQYTYEYDEQKRLTATNKLGVGDDSEPYRVEYTYQADGKRLSTTRRGGELSLTSSRTYDLAGRVSSRTDEKGLTTYYSYANATASAGTVDTVTLPGGFTQITENYFDGRQKSVTGSAAVATYFDYGVDSEHNQTWEKTSIGSANGAQWRKSYTDMLGQNVKNEQSGYGNSILTSVQIYNSLGQLVKSTAPGMADTLYEYDSLGNPVRSGLDVDASGTLVPASDDRISDTETLFVSLNDAWWRQETQNVYGTSGSAASKTVSVSRSRLTGHPVNTVSENVSIDIHGNQTTSIVTLNRSGKTVTQTVTYPDSNVSAQTVTVNGLKISERSKENITVTASYDALERQISQTDPRTGTSAVSYYTAGTGKTGQIHTATDAANHVTTYDYEAATGRRKSVKNALNKFTYFEYNARGQQIRVWGDTDYPVETIYNNLGQQTQLKTYRYGDGWSGAEWPESTGNADITTWTYDASSGLAISKTDASGKTVTYTYTDDGKLLTRTWARRPDDTALVTTYSYDAATGEMTGADYSDESMTDVAYTYNRLGQQASVSDAVGTRTFAYNGNFDLVSETISGIYSKVLTRTYSTTGMKGRLTGVSVGNVPAASYSYDAVGRISGINNISFGYLANSNLLSTAARPNNVNTAWNYEANRNLVTSVENKLNNAVISKYTYSNDVIGRRTAMARSGSVFSAADTLSYLYNDRSEVTGANSNAASSPYHYAYSFDNIGNRLTANLAGTPWTYTANNLNQYSAFTKNQVAETPSYDDDGDMLTRDGWIQTWNAENRLIKAEKGTTKLEFAYDYMGRRIFRKVYSNGTLTSHIRFVYDGYKLMEELDALNNNAVLRRYAWSPVGLDVPVSVYDAVANSTYYYHTDANKNITELTNASGSVVAHYEYSPFGKVVVSTGTYANTNPFRFSSEYHDDETGLVYYNYRYYSPELGRWLSRDPIGEQGGVNLYGVVRNTPNNLVDFCGLLTDAQEKLTKEIENLIVGFDTPIDCSSKDGGCTKITIFIETGTPDENLLNSLIGHTGIAIGDDFYDVGPQKPGGWNQEKPASQWWDGNRNFYQWAPDETPATIGLSKINDNINSLATDIVIKVEFCLCQKDSDNTKKYWDELYKRMAEKKGPLFMPPSLNPFTKKKNVGFHCTSAVILSLSGASADESPSFIQGFTDPVSYLRYLLSNQKNMCGPLKGKKVSATIIRRYE